MLNCRWDWKGLTCLELFTGLWLGIFQTPQDPLWIKPREIIKHFCIQKYLLLLKGINNNYLKVVVYFINFAGISCCIKNIHLVNFYIHFLYFLGMYWHTKLHLSNRVWGWQHWQCSEMCITYNVRMYIIKFKYYNQINHSNFSVNW